MTLRFRMLLQTTALLVVVIATTTVVLLGGMRRAMITELRDDSLALARLLAKSVDFASRMPQKAENLVGEQMVVQALIAAHLVAVAEGRAGMSSQEIHAILRDITDRSVLSEFWITDEKGRAIYTNTDVRDFVFSPDKTKQPQAHVFWRLLTEREGTAIQGKAKREIDPRVFKYVGVSGVDKPRIVQVGYEAHVLAEIEKEFDLQKLVDQLTGASNILSICITDTQGSVIATSSRPEPRATCRPTVGQPLPQEGRGLLAEALAGRETWSELPDDLLQIAVPMERGDDGRSGAVLIELSTERTRRVIAAAVQRGAAVAVLLLAIGGIASILLAATIAEPIHGLTQETARIRDLDLGERRLVRSGIREIQAMSNGIQAMKVGLRSFSKYVPRRLVRQLIETGQEARIGGQTRELTIFFSDIAGFTSISELLSPQQLMTHLSEYLDALTVILSAHGATVDKYIGDGILAFWGAPESDEDQAFHACRAALECRRRLEELNAEWEREGKSPFYTRIGIHSGESIVGNIGSTERINYSVLGDAVNLASRLEEINKLYGTQIVVSEATRAQVGDSFVFRALDVLSVRGKTQAVTIYELVAESADELTSQQRDLHEQFEAARQAYLRRQWDEAIQILQRVSLQGPWDGPTQVYLQRCVEYRANPPSEADWSQT